MKKDILTATDALRLTDRYNLIKCINDQIEWACQRGERRTDIHLEGRFLDDTGEGPHILVDSVMNEYQKAGYKIEEKSFIDWKFKW